MIRICKNKTSMKAGFTLLEMVLVIASSTMLGTSVHSSSSTLSTRSNTLSLFAISTV